MKYGKYARGSAVASGSVVDCPASESQSQAFAPRLRSAAAVLLLGGIALAAAAPAFAQHYQQTNLVSDVSGMAAVTDPALVNPWGLSRSATSPWWVSDNGTGLSTLYNGTGAPQALIVTIPPASGQQPPSAPTGTVFNGSIDFELATGQPARFLFASENGTISGWNPAVNATNAVTKVDRSGHAVYKGLALGQIGSANYLYAANFFAGTVDVFDRTFSPMNLGAAAFRDRLLPRGFAPFNVQVIGDTVYVTYAQQDSTKFDEVDGAGRGFVNAFSTSGVLKTRFRWGRWMNAPWGVALAPAGFGRFSGMLLVGNFGSGKIAAFNPSNGHFRGMLRTTNHRALSIDGLWALSFGNGAGAGPATTLYFTAGIEDEAHGLFGTITPLNDGDDDHDDDDTGD